MMAAAREHRPDLVITDVRMPPGYTDEGLRAAVTLRAGDPGAAVLVLSQYTATAYAAELLRPAGGAGVAYLLKDRVGDIAEVRRGADPGGLRRNGDRPGRGPAAAGTAARRRP